MTNSKGLTVYFDPDSHDVLGFSITNFSEYYKAHATAEGDFHVDLPAKVPANLEEEMDSPRSTSGRGGPSPGARAASVVAQSPTIMAPGPLPWGTIGKTFAIGLTCTSTSAGPSPASASASASSSSAGWVTVVPGTP